MGSQCSMQGEPSACSCSRCLQASVASAGDVRVLRSASSSRLAMTATACMQALALVCQPYGPHQISLMAALRVHAEECAWADQQHDLQQVSQSDTACTQKPLQPQAGAPQKPAIVSKASCGLQYSIIAPFPPPGTGSAKRRPWEWLHLPPSACVPCGTP